MIHFIKTRSGKRQISQNLTTVMLPPMSILPIKPKLAIVRSVDVNILPNTFPDVPPKPTPRLPPSSRSVYTPAYTRRRPPAKPPTQKLAWCFVRDPITGEFKQIV